MIRTYLCNYVTISSNNKLVCEVGKYISVDRSGTILAISDKKPNNSFIDFSEFLMIPIFSDLHLHASQYNIRGLGYDLPLNDFFEKVLYASEKRYDYEDEYIDANKNLVHDLWYSGIMCSSILTAIEIEPTIDLMNRLEKSGLTANVGKMNCDLSLTGKPRETIEKSLASTVVGIEFGESLSKRVNYAITPEFIPTCSSELMKALGELAKVHKTPLQLHFAEGEFDDVHLRRRYPNQSYLEVYDEFSLLEPEKSLVIHGVSASKTDFEIIKEKKLTLVHCATALSDNPSDRNISVVELLEEGINVGYGSDIGGGGTLNPLSNLLSIRRYSNIVSVEKDTKRLSLEQAFALMTKNSGSYFGEYGVIEPGYKFSVLVINDKQQRLSLHQRFERFIYSTDLSKIIYRYHNGNKIEEPDIN